MVVTALIVVTFACAPPKGTPVAATTPIPSPTPTPTAPLQVTTQSFHAGEVGVDYTPVDLVATGGVQPYTWTTSAGVLPDGLTLTSAGHLSGTPTRGGGFSFSVQVSDAGGTAAALPGTIGIAAAPSASLIPACARACSVEVGCVDVCGAFGSLTGGTAPFTYAVKPGGFIPVGTHVHGLALAGTFTQRAQYWQFTVVVTDALGQTTSITPTFFVFPHISFAAVTVTCPYNGCGATVPYQGGSGTPNVQVAGWKTTCTSAPCNVPPKVSAGAGTVSINVLPWVNTNGYQGTLTLTLTDNSLCGAATYCSTSGTVNVVVQTG